MPIVEEWTYHTLPFSQPVWPWMVGPLPPTGPSAWDEFQSYPMSCIAADIRDCDSEGALIRAAWRWWSTPLV